jgi:putative transposase
MVKSMGALNAGSEARVALVQRLVAQHAAGELRLAELRQTAHDCGISVRTLWRWMAATPAPPGQPGRPGYRLSQVDRDAYAAAHGNAAAAWRMRAAAGGAQPSMRVFQMAIKRELLPIERAAAASGVDGQRRHTVYLRWEVSGRNDRWEADHVELPVLVVPPRAVRPRRPWVTLFIDAYSRLVMGWALALGPSAATVLAALRMGVHIDPARGDFGGGPRALRPDRGLEFVSEALVGVCGVLGIQLLPAPRYTPHLKGKVERFGRTLAQEFLCTLPFYTDGPRDKTGRLYGPQLPPLALERFAAEFRDWVAAYNTGRPHSGIDRCTPFDRWHADATPLRIVPEQELRFLLLPAESRKINKDGIHFGGVKFIAAELNGRVGQTVEVRAMPHDLRQIEVFVGGRWLTTAYPQGALGAEQRAHILQRRQADAAELARRQRRASRLARIRLEPVTGASPPQETTVVTPDQQGMRRGSYRADDEDLRRQARTNLLGLGAAR